MPMRPIFLLLVLALAPGCRNSCQQICNDMADFAKEQCGIEFPADQVSQCIQEHSDVDKEGKEACRDAPALDSEQEEWTCDDIEEYFD